jgi:hypothetical protein
MTTPSGHQVPVQATSGATYDTSVEAPAQTTQFMTHGAPIADPGAALRNPHAAEVNRLHSFLMTNFPGEMQRTNIAVPQTPVDVAIRLLQGLGSTGAGARCNEEYCNLPVNHDGDHGYINYETR